jgi:hypothetical protein
MKYLWLAVAPFGLVIGWLLMDWARLASQPAAKVPVAQAQATPAHDAKSLCSAYGGVREVASRTYTIRGGVQETGIAAYCNDGSYVHRSTGGK